MEQEDRKLETVITIREQLNKIAGPDLGKE